MIIFVGCFILYLLADFIICNARRFLLTIVNDNTDKKHRKISRYYIMIRGDTLSHKKMNTGDIALNHFNWLLKKFH
jgi:hypothetical protein